MSVTDRVLEQGKALNPAIETLEILEALAGQADRDEKGFVTVQDASRHVTSGVAVGQPTEHEPDTDVAVHRGG